MTEQITPRQFQEAAGVEDWFPAGGCSQGDEADVATWMGRD
jgi:hypothetical protein